MNDSVDYRLVEDIFLEALELPPGAREELLGERCGADGPLRREVESLLASHDSDGLVPEMEEERPFGGRYPDRIGEYRIVRPLGEGGMGVVTLAIREGPGFEQTVALKLIRGTIPDPMLARRLEEERRILARLEHPGIARFVDGGVTPDGQPYYAMEYVRGDDILAYCDDHRLDVEGRLRLFIDVCDAVHYAHHQLVVHRDLKPSNILVTPEGRPKLLDFGIAKNLEAVAGPEHTARWITTAYASPEQVTGDPVTTLSDVYALGVLLCELLAGHRPYDTTASSLEQLTRVILHEPPRKPSELVARGLPRREGTGPGAAEVAERRGTTAGRLEKALRGDLDLVVGKALAKEPSRRYDSARDLAEDVRRYLEGRPIEARPDSSVYRFGKFYRRHRGLVIAASMAALAVVGGSAAAAWQARMATAERDRAEIEAARARQVTGLMTDIFRLGDPTQTLGDTVGVRQVLREGVARVEETLGDDPVLQATLLLELGKIHRNLGLLGEAERLVSGALALREAHEPGTVAYADALGLHGLVLADIGASDRAGDVLQHAVDLRRDLLPAPDTTLATLLNSLGWHIRDRGDYEKARAVFEEALAIRRTRLGDDHPAVANSMLGVASTFHDEGAFDRAEITFQAALAQGGAQPSPVVTTALVNLGMVRRLREEYGDAEDLLRAGLDMALRLYGPEHLESLEARKQLGATLTSLGKYDEAQPLLLRNLEIAVRTLGEGHEQTRGAREALATVEHDLGRFARASALTDSVIAAKLAAHDGDHPGVVFSLVAAGDILLDAGSPGVAATRYREALDMGARLGGNQGVYGMLARHGLARVALDAGELAAADSLLDVADAIAAESLRESHRYVLDLRRTRARTLLARGRAIDVLGVLAPVLERERRVRPSPHPRIGATLALIAEARALEGDREGALVALREADAELGRLPPDHPQRRRVAALLARYGDEPADTASAPLRAEHPDPDLDPST